MNIDIIEFVIAFAVGFLAALGATSMLLRYLSHATKKQA